MHTHTHLCSSEAGGSMTEDDKALARLAAQRARQDAARRTGKKKGGWVMCVCT